MGYNKKILSQATAGLNKAKAPAKKKDTVINPVPLISNEGFKQGPPPEGTNYRIPSNTIINPTPYNILARASTGEERIISKGDTTPQTFEGAYYVDEYELKKGGQKKSSKKYSRSITATNRLFDKNPLFKKPKSKKKKIFDPNAKYYQTGGSNTDSRFLGEPNLEGYRPYNPPGYSSKFSYNENPENWLYWMKDNIAYRKDYYDNTYQQLRPPTKEDMKLLEDYSKWVMSSENTPEEIQNRYRTEIKPLLGSFDRPIRPTNNPRDIEIEKMLSDNTFCDDCNYRYDAYNIYDFSNTPLENENSNNSNSNNSDYNYRYHRERNPWTQTFEVMSPDQHRLLEREAYKLKNQGIKLTSDNMPIIDNRELIDVTSMKPVGVRPWNAGIGFRWTENDILQNNKPLELNLTPEQIDEYRKGGWIVEELPKAQKGITISDPKEYAFRKQMYDDSLSLFNAYQFQKANYKPGYDAWLTDVGKSYTGGKEALKKAREKNLGKPLQKSYYNKDDKKSFYYDKSAEKNYDRLYPQEKFIVDKYKSIVKGNPNFRIGMHNSPDLWHKTINPVGTYYAGAMNPIYKKPVQPVYNSDQDLDYMYEGQLQQNAPQQIPPYNQLDEAIVLPLRKPELFQTPKPEPNIQANEQRLIKRYNPNTNTWELAEVPANSTSAKKYYEREEWRLKNKQTRPSSHMITDEELQKYEQDKQRQLDILSQFQQGGQTDSWGRKSDSPWYGFDPDKKQFTTKDQWGRSPGGKWYGFNPDNKTWTKGNKAQQPVENKESQEERYKTLYEPLENKFYESIETDDDFNRMPVNNQDFITLLFIKDDKRNIPPADPVLKEMQKKLLDLENTELKKLMQKDYSDISLTNFGDYIPSNVSYKDALKYVNHIQKLKKQGYTFQDGGYIVKELIQAQKGGQKRNTYLPGAWANTAPDLIEPGQDAFTYPSSTPTIDPFITESRLATDTSREALRNFMQDYYEGNQRLDQERFNQRPEYFKSLRKSEKVSPTDQLSIFEYNKLVKLNPNYEKELKDQGYFINKNKERGFVELYPSNEVLQDIMYSTIEQGKSVDETLKQLEKRGYGSTKDIKKQLGEKNLNIVETAVKQHYAFNPNYIPPYRTGTYAPGVSTDFGKVDTSVDLKNKWKENDIITLARDKDFIDSFDINNFDSSSPNARNDEKWNSQIVAKLRSGEWGWQPKENKLVKLSKSEAYKPLSTGRKSAAENLISQTKAPATGNPFTQMGISAFWDEQEALSKRAKDYNKLGEDEWRQKYAPSFQQMQERFQEGKTPIEISDVDAWRPKKMLKDNQFYQYGFEQPTGVDPITGETITKTVSPEEYAGQTVYMSPEESERYNKQMIGDNVENFMRSPVFYLPGAIATGALLGPGGLGRAALNYAPIKSLPGLNLGNALNAEFAYQAFKDDGFAEQAYDAALEGDRGEALKNLGLTGLAAQPYAKGARSLYNIGKGLSTPGTAQTIATNLPFSAAYKSPIGSGLALQNPTWSSATKEILPGLTSRLNKTLGSTLGELKLYGTGTQPAVKNPNLLTGSASAVNQIPGGRYAELPTGRKEYSFPPDVEIPEHRLIKYAQEASGDKISPLFNPYIKANYTGLDFGDAEFQPFSPGWQAQQELSNLATFGKQPLLKRRDFATNEEMMIDKLRNKYKGDLNSLMKEAEAEGISPDAVLERTVRLMEPSERDMLDQSKPFYLPENWGSSNKAALWNQNYGSYKPFAKELNEFGSMGGKAPVSFGESGEFDQYYWDQIKRNEDFLTGDYNMSPETRKKIQSKVSDLYKKGINQGLQQKGFDLENPMRYTGYDAMRTLSPNQYGGELPEAQFGLTKYLAPATKLLKNIPSFASNISKAQNLNEAFGALKGIPTAASLPRLTDEELKAFRKIQEIGKLRALNKPLSQQYTYALQQQLPDEYFEKIFFKPKTEIEKLLPGLIEQEKQVSVIPINERFNLERPPRPPRVRNFETLQSNYLPEQDVIRHNLSDYENININRPVDYNTLYSRNINPDAFYNTRSQSLSQSFNNKSRNLLTSLDNKSNRFISKIPTHQGPIHQNLFSLHLGSEGSLKDVHDKVNKAVSSATDLESGDVFTGSLNTSHNSYLPQLKQVFRYTEGSPQFLGYQDMNHLGYLSNFNFPASDIARYLNTEIDQQIKRGTVPKDILRPFSINDKVRLPHYGIKQFEEGGYMDAELTNEEIELYRQLGYIIKEL